MSSPRAKERPRRARALPTKDEVLAILAREGDRPVHAREIFSGLDLSEGVYPGLLRILDDLVFDGLLIARPGQKFKLAKRTAEGRGARVTGSITVNARGFGFVTPDVPAASTSPASPATPDKKPRADRSEDVFVGAEGLGGAMHQDRVVVRVVATTAKGKEGIVEEILSRGTIRVAGVLRRRGKGAWVEPDDTRVRGPIELSRDVDREGPAGNSGEDGDAVVVRITRHPDLAGENPVGAIEAVLGRPGELTVEARKILLVGGVEELHSAEAVREAESFGGEVPEEMLRGREDLTHLPLPTIDPEDARDHDDAVWVERRETGGYRAWIAIADVSSYVRPGTALDAEALARGCSVYLPDRAVPMLPRALSSALCSLLPDVLRLCLCVVVDVDAGGRVERSDLVRGFMKSQAKLTYGGVARALGLTTTPPRDPKAEALRDGLSVARELGLLLRNRKKKRGALDFALPEAKIILDAEGLPVDVHRRDEDAGVKKAYELIEELMILANEVVASWLIARQIPTVFRVHLPPDETKLDRLAAMCEALGVPFDPEDAKDPRTLSALVTSFADHPLASILSNLLLRSMKQAQYDPSNLGHFGLASKAYLHFTSPIRRYPDLVVHRAVHDAVLARPADRSGEAAEALAEAARRSSSNERRAMEVERAVGDLYRTFAMKDRVGEELEGTVTAVTGGGLFVALDHPFVDVFVRLEDLGDDTFTVDEDNLRVQAAFSGVAIQLGDRLLVEILEAAILRRTVYARRVVAEGESRTRRPRLPVTRAKAGPPGNAKPRRKPGKNQPDRRASSPARGVPGKPGRPKRGKR